MSFDEVYAHLIPPEEKSGQDELGEWPGGWP